MLAYHAPRISVKRPSRVDRFNLSSESVNPVAGLTFLDGLTLLAEQALKAARALRRGACS